MGDTNKNVSLKQTHQPNPILEPLFHALDPISLILNQNSHSEQQQQPFPLMLTSSDSFIMERGPKYNAYAELRETRLRMKCMRMQEQEHEEDLEPIIKLATPPTKQVKFQKGSLFIAQSVPDFSATLRKENRKPVNTTLPSMMEMTPPPSKTKSFFSKGNGVLSSSRGSKSASAGEKKKDGGGGAVLLMARKSYASIDELKSLSSATAIAINGEGRGGRNNRVMGKTVSRHRQF
ncbi:uncharacterized protein LOC133294689 [Gastrolobium bilobum]|uniref:uncharacterized protein LOC133294689 n=1 Tax=Gastrolobium bilobum TaxID=150636 RepID=UPI002AB12075|nr:uncharacterized protein LOC133294689 [Gastrolobium bilobum]